MRASSILCACIILFSGCDSAGPGTVILTFEAAPVRFSIASSEMTIGTETSVTCACALSVDEFLTAQGFSRADLAEATLRTASIRTLFPIAAPLADFDGIRLILSTDGTGREVAALDSPPAATESELSVATGSGLLGILASGTFRPELRLIPGAPTAGRNYELELAMSFRLEVSDF